MISSGNLVAYALASFILIVIPGPSVLFVVGRALAHGRRTELATVCGNAAGNYVVAICVALGIGAVVQRSEPVFVAVKLIGALYLDHGYVAAKGISGSLLTALNFFAGST